MGTTDFQVDRPHPGLGVLASTFDLERREGDTVPFAKQLIGGRRLPIDSYQIVVRLEAADVALEHLLHGRIVWDIDVVSESTSVI